MPDKTKTPEPSQWVDKYADLLYRFAWQRVNHEETAKELVQETFLSALKSLEHFKGEVSEKNWLFTILKNKIIDFYRKKAPAYLEDLKRGTQDDAGSFDENDHWHESTIMTDWSITENNVLEHKEFMQVLARCHQKLNAIQQAVFSMKYLEEIESDEICKELSITPSNYWVLLHRAKLALRKCLEKNWIGA